MSRTRQHGIRVEVQKYLGVGKGRHGKGSRGKAAPHRMEGGCGCVVGVEYAKVGGARRIEGWEIVDDER